MEKTLSEYVSWLNSMTTTELINQFPGEFHLLDGRESINESVRKLLANDAILWRMVKEYNQKLLKTKNNELSEMITNVHEAMEGRYDLTGYDLHMIHGTLCDINNYSIEAPVLNEVIKAFEVCFASLCTYGKHPIIEKQVEKALTITNENR